MDEDVKMDTLSETDNFSIIRTHDDENGTMYHVEMGGVSLHLMPEEWEEFMVAIRDADNNS